MQCNKDCIKKIHCVLCNIEITHPNDRRSITRNKKNRRIRCRCVINPHYTFLDKQFCINCFKGGQHAKYDAA